MAETKKVIVDIIVNTSDATEGFDTVQKELDDTTKRVKTLKTETDKTSKSMSQGFTAGADAAALIPGPIGQAATAVGGLKTAFDAGLKRVDVYVKGPGAGRESSIRSISQSGIEVVMIKDVTPLPHNGCRPPKRRRI